ncbi:prephenate dehydratase [Spongisporangium articulatum]|uniref:Prephenate dehydratase n=1 Tax=Spongisporangium articulatum TaxID=3362603 RepID=A0ABW8AIB8_9ACTN
MKYGYLGPEGTFSEAAVRKLTAARGIEADLLPMHSVLLALDAVRAGELEAAVVPIENSVEGGVSATLDALTAGEPLQVVGEEVVPVTFDFVVRPGLGREDVTRVASHPHGLAQCSNWLHEQFPKATLIPALSTASAAVGLLEDDAAYDGALCSPLAAQKLGLTPMYTDIGDNPNAMTRFVLVSRPGRLPAPTGADKTTLVVFLKDERAGALLEILEQFATRGINLNRLESRPTGDGLGRYCMSIDAEGHVEDARLSEALKGLHRVSAHVRFLGSYPRADGEPPHVRPENSNASFAEADAWLNSILSS